MGRPSAFSDAIADAICERISNGESLRSICEKDEFPHRSTVLRWQADNKEFAAKCARAREAQADFVFDELAKIEQDTLDKVTAPDVARVVLSSKQWRAMKLAPKKYGDKQEIEITDKRVSDKPLTADEWLSSHS